MSPAGRRCRAAPGRALRCGVRAAGARWAPRGRGTRTARGLWASPDTAAPLPDPRGWPVPTEPGRRSPRAGGGRRPLLGCSGRWGCGVGSVQPPLCVRPKFPFLLYGRLVKAFYLYGFGALIAPLPRVPFNSPVLSLGYEQMLPFSGKCFAPPTWS